MKIAFITLGCKLNYAETSTYERGIVGAFSRNDALQEACSSDGVVEVVPATAVADAYLVNTCSVTEHSDKKCRNIIRKLHRTAPGAAIFVTGCYAQLKRPEIEALEGVRQVFGAKEKREVVAAVTEYLAGLKAQAVEAAAGAGTECLTNPEVSAQTSRGAMFAAYSSGERTRSFLKVQDGCDFRCNYCTVPNARGESRNIPIADVLTQAHEISAAGIKEIVLTGVNTGDFGKTTGENFFDLIRQLNDVKGIERYRISSIEPNLLTEEMVDWIASGTKFLPHFHIPLQSGSDAILREMGRRYDTAAFVHKISYIRSRLETDDRPPVFFGIDVIVGFPGETDTLFEETYNFLKDRIRPAFIHIFPYSRRAGTPAARRKDQVQDRIKTERVERLEALCAALHAEFVASNLGRTEQVLWESSDKNGRMYGYTGNYIRVERPYSPSSVGRIETITLTPAETHIWAETTKTIKK